eukprot:TRINITY_DN4531_c0_g1_i1.p1 TRINITY_DN4531_c0_g1~~TRINITY_DN4531_c0_g1_i1.p1  ORF type:complete len:382 (+),score=77.18 TRINITY_DN4531_c0_g1_i1:3-1148(+)
MWSLVLLLAPAWASETRPLSLIEDASRRTNATGQHEWWNFYAEDPAAGVTISAIFLNGDMFNADYAVAFQAHLEDPDNNPAPNPDDYHLLQMNIAVHEVKIFTSIRDPPGTVAVYSQDRPYGRVSSPYSDSWFEAAEVNGERVWRVHLDSPDMYNRFHIRADIEFRDRAQGFAVVGGFFGPIVGETSGVNFPVAKPLTSGSLTISDKRGGIAFSHEFSDGGGHTDHVFGEFWSTLCTSYYFGRLVMDDSDLMYYHNKPQDESIEPFGWVFRLPSDGSLPWSYKIVNITESGWVSRGGVKLDYFDTLEMQLAEGRVTNVLEMIEASEDWPFQVTGIGHFDIDIPGDLVTVRDGIAEYGFLDGILDPFYVFLFSQLALIPFLP